MNLGFKSKLILLHYDFAIWGRVESMSLGFKSKLMNSLFKQFICTNKICS